MRGLKTVRNTGYFKQVCRSTVLTPTAAGDILFYMANGGAFDENNSLLKLGRVRLSLSPNPFAANASRFEQRLNINDGDVTFTGTDNTTLKLWVDVFSSAIHVEITGHSLMNLTASFETWRVTGYNLTFPESREIFLHSFPDPAPSSADWHRTIVLGCDSDNRTSGTLPVPRHNSIFREWRPELSS
jgi:hypothetical protein